MIACNLFHITNHYFWKKKFHFFPFGSDSADRNWIHYVQDLHVLCDTLTTNMSINRIFYWSTFSSFLHKMYLYTFIYTLYAEPDLFQCINEIRFSVTCEHLWNCLAICSPKWWSFCYYKEEILLDNSWIWKCVYLLCIVYDWFCILLKNTFFR